MAGRAMARVYIDGLNEVLIWTEHSGGQTNPATREVPESGIPATNRREPTGGEEREDLVLTFTEMEDEGFFLEDLHEALVAIRDAPEPAGRRRNVQVIFYRDKAMTVAQATLNVVDAWPYLITVPEADRTSPDARTFQATFSHRGSTYTRTA